MSCGGGILVDLGEDERRMNLLKAFLKKKLRTCERSKITRLNVPAPDASGIPLRCSIACSRLSSAFSIRLNLCMVGNYLCKCLTVEWTLGQLNAAAVGILKIWNLN